jgi:hypothetical protein
MESIIKDIRKSVKPTLKDTITLPEYVKREINLVQPYAGSVDKAYDFVTRFNNWRSGKLTLQNPNIYEKNFVTQMSTKEWIELEDKLKLSESNQQ